VGVDQSTTCAKNAASESLATTATWYFTTGTSVYSAPEDTVPETQPEEEVAESPVTKVLEPKVSTSFAITDTDPDQYSANLGTLNTDEATVTYNGPITVTFNRLLASGVSVDQDWMSISAAGVDGDPSTTTSTPSGVVSNTTGKTLTWTPPAYLGNNQSWCINNQITITVSEGVQDYEGNELGDNFQFMFTTRYSPYYCTVEKIRAVIGPFIRDVNDDAIGRNIYLNSLEAYNIANTIYSQNEWALNSPTFAAKMWTCCKTQYDILYAKLLDVASAGPGQIKRLGDFTIQESTALQEGIKGALDKSAECTNTWLKQLLGKYRRAGAKMAVKGVTSTATPPSRGVRTWEVPTSAEGIGGNKRGERRIKSPGLYDDWA